MKLPFFVPTLRFRPVLVIVVMGVAMNGFLLMSGLGQMPEDQINESPIVNEQSNDFASYSLTGQKLTIAGDNNTITVRGETPAVVITGSGNTVKIEAVDKIEIAGSNNTVTWSAAVSLDLPVVVNQGTGNTVSSGAVE